MEQKSHVPVRTASSQKIHTEWARASQKILQKLDGTTRFLNEYSSTRRRSEASMTQLQQLVQQSSSNIATEQKERIRRLSRSPMRRRLTALIFEQKNQSINEIPSEKEILRILSHLEEETHTLQLFFLLTKLLLQLFQTAKLLLYLSLT